MKIGVVSDTHSMQVPPQLFDDFKDVDLIIHAGDFCTSKDLDKFRKIHPVKAVYGNMDDTSISDRLPRRQIIECEGIRIGLTHGRGSRYQVLDSVRKEFENDEVDMVIFGHSHSPTKKKIQGVLYFNPGSPNDKVFAPYCSYGILNIKEGNIDAEIIKVKNP